MTAPPVKKPHRNLGLRLPPRKQKTDRLGTRLKLRTSRQHQNRRWHGE